MKKLILLKLLCISLISCQPEKKSFVNQINLSGVDGQYMDIEQFEGKILILNLWATWCGPCIKEMPDLASMQKELPADFALILASDEELQTIQKFTQTQPEDLLFAQLQTPISTLGAYSLPTTFVIGGNGQLLETLVGARKWDSSEQIEQLLTYLK